MSFSRVPLILLLAGSFAAPHFASATETIAEKVEIAGDRAIDKTKKTYRSAKDSVCEMVDGKMQCQKKRMANRRMNATEKMKTEIKAIQRQSN
jgi:hypothetical protein